MESFLLSIYENYGILSLFLILFMLFTVWLFKSFIDKFHNRQMAEEQFVMDGIELHYDILSNLKYADKIEAVKLCYKAAKYMPPQSAKAYIGELEKNDVDVIIVREIIVKNIENLQNRRCDIVSDGSSTMNAAINPIKRSPVAAIGYAFYGVITLYAMLLAFLMLTSRIPSNDVAVPLLTMFLSVFPFYSIPQYIDKTQYNKLISKKRAIIFTFIYIFLLLSLLVILFMGFYIWNHWFVILGLLTVNVLSYCLNKYNSNKYQ